jgi:hypothetical protein
LVNLFVEAVPRRTVDEDELIRRSFKTASGMALAGTWVNKNR